MAADYSDFFKIRDEIMELLQIDDTNIGEKALLLPLIKLFWIAKMIQFKILIKQIEEEKHRRLSEFTEKMLEYDATVTKETIIKKFNSSKEVLNMNERVEVLNIIVEYLNDAKFALGRATDDIKNKIEIDKLERL